MKYGLIGKPLGHSYSREIHRLIADYDYELKELDENEVAPFLQKREFNAINVTIPYKQTVMPYLDFISDDAKNIGAVNTIVNYGEKLCGYNTDFAGMRALIEKNGISVKGKKVLVFGTGGTSKTACAVCSALGAREIHKVSRSEKDGAITYDTAREQHSDAEIIVNATPSGMYPYVDGEPMDISCFDRLQAVVDAIYNPLCTNLVLDAKEKGAVGVGGLYMLVAQAVYASALFLNKDVDESVTEKAYEKIVTQKRNVVLIGMPSSGKTTVGKRLAELTGREFVDTDEEIVKSIGTSIADFFEKNGEEAFRKIESEVLSEYAKRAGIIVATGGGAVLKKENVRAIKRNSVAVFLDRPLDLLVATSDRPLASDKDKVKKLFEQRYDIYKSVADEIVDGSGDIDEVANQIRRKLGI